MRINPNDLVDVRIKVLIKVPLTLKQPVNIPQRRNELGGDEKSLPL
jgi:hypothetical protein